MDGCIMHLRINIIITNNYYLQANTKLNKNSQTLDCTDKNSFVETLMPVAVEVLLTKIQKKMAVLAGNSGINFCSWFKSTFDKDSGEQLYNFMYSKLNSKNICDINLSR